MGSTIETPRPFGTVPTSATLRPTPLLVRFDESALDELNTLLKYSRIAPETYENRQSDGRYGVTREWVLRMKQRWEGGFDWRDTEKRINDVPNYKVPITARSGHVLDIHFAALLSENPTAIPIILLHGWPGSFLEFLPMLNLLTTRYTPSTLPYHFIVPSHPGYGLSGPPPLDGDFNLEDMAYIHDALMRGLGFEGGYVVQGGDIGSHVSRPLLANHASCKAGLLNFIHMPEPTSVPRSALTQKENENADRANEWFATASGYALEQATRPSTIGFALSASPIALLAWIGEKFIDWTDDTPSDDTILEHVSLYWLTNTIATTVYPYRHTPKDSPGVQNNPAWFIRKPFGFVSFPKELSVTPKAWADTTGDIVFFREHDKGGHFAALEQPEVLLKDIEDFVAQVWDRT
ncbi:alpha/beta-Hydrolase [Pseudohyphozyma bogoriensis]|nr:alpha/beta-Hydrolase [Pseudohyphozyma bogoriensis]